MQKKVIALAVAGLMSGAAFAQSNVTISGRVDVGFSASSISGTNGAADTTKGINSGNYTTSRIAFSGEEALGNGLKAIFMLEYGLANDISQGVGGGAAGTGTSSRQQWIGLQSNMGTVTAGQVYVASDNMNDAMEATNFSPRGLLMNNATAFVAGGWNGNRWANTVKYVSPEFMGLTATANYGFAPLSRADGTAYDASTGANQDQERGVSAGLDYVAGPLSASIYYDRITDRANTTASDAKALSLQGRYDFGILALLGTYEKGVADAAAGAPDFKQKVWSIGATAPMGANGLGRVMYARTKANNFGGANTKDKIGRAHV